VASAEDIILTKSLWRKPSGSMKQWMDVLRILKVQGELLDFDYLWQWGARLGVMDDLGTGHSIKRARKRINPTEPAGFVPVALGTSPTLTTMAPLVLARPQGWGD
jgi:hypothetical protein